jgi:hypothetical protein
MNLYLKYSHSMNSLSPIFKSANVIKSREMFTKDFFPFDSLKKRGRIDL